ncbi:hypothetical protein DEI93_07125 [Curtobacterium sp. MCBD17_035]|uniref:hypothetical protein n=1 Tax=Curtobacterium sp. MCBD17_035 TaxID=2175673 RepID=UPI000DA98BC6|nr:hypothetical protein [Curtobacterium sp. MCBD17_035]WIB68793.1 hypothetical protein DEI93_07125 [Curtobacterium sp. MCBD17_035]
MNNRQAALIAAASSVTDSAWGKSITKDNVAKRITDNARLFELWLIERDWAEREHRAPMPFELVQWAARAVADVEAKRNSTVTALTLRDNMPTFLLTDDTAVTITDAAGHWKPRHS